MSSRKLVISILAVVVLAAAAGVAYRIYLNPARDTAIDLVPSDAVVYGSLFLSPSTHQKQALGALLKHFPEASTPELAKNELERLLDGALAPNGIDFTHDVEPWIGRQVAFFVEGGGSDPPADAILIATRAPDEAMNALVKAADAKSDPEPSHLTYRGFDYIASSEFAVGIVGDFAVVANSSQEFQNVVRAHDGKSLGDEQGFRDAIAPLPQDRVATLYFDSSQIANLSFGAAGASSPPPPPSMFQQLPAVAVGAFLRPDSVVFDVAIQRSGSPSTPSISRVLDDLPASTWAAIEIPSLGQDIARALSALPGSLFLTAGLRAELTAQTGLNLDRDLLAWMGGAVLYVTGTDRVAGGVVIDSSAPKVSRRTVETLGESLLLVRQAGVRLTPQRPHHTGFSAVVPGIDRRVSVSADDEAVDVLLGTQGAGEGERTLGQTEWFAAAQRGLGPGFSLKGYLDPRRLSSAALGGSDAARLGPTATAVLRRLSYIALGTRGDHDTLFARIVIGVD